MTEQIAKEIEAAEESNELHSDILHQADVLKTTLGYHLDAQGLQREYDTLVEISDLSVGEFEKDCSWLQKKITTFLNQTATFSEPGVMVIRETFVKHEADVAARLNEARGSRRDRRDRVIADSSLSEAPRPSRSSKLRLDLPDFSGHPLEWHHFYQLFTSVLDRVGDDFSDREKACFLIKAMKSPEAEQIVKSHATAEDGYRKALKALVMRYGSAKKVFPHLVHKMTSKETISFSQQGFARYREKYILPLQAMQELKCVNIS